MWIYIGIAAYLLTLTLFLVGWKRWHDRMAVLDGVKPGDQ